MTADRDAWRELLELDRARMKERRKRMEQYDRDVYLPAIAEIQRKCEASGHGEIVEEYSILRTVKWLICRACRKKVGFINLEQLETTNERAR